MVERLHTPLQLVSHLGVGDGINPSLNRGPIEIMFADPGGISKPLMWQILCVRRWRGLTRR